MKKNTVIEIPIFFGFAKRKANRSAVILAGGDGSRLKTLTRAIAGDERPKQFCPILGGETLLEVTQKRVGLKIAPENIFYSLTKKHEHFYQPILSRVLPEQIVAQPENKGTAPAILYSLLRLAKADPQAAVAFFPSDHYFSDDRAFMNRVGNAFQAVETDTASIVLLGIEPDKPETSYGWIEPSEKHWNNFLPAICQVKRFWEKPSPATAQFLMKNGGLWNSFVMIGTVETFLQLIRKCLPELYGKFAASSGTFGTYAENAMMSAVYARIFETNFSSEVLEKAGEELSVLRVGDIGWSDLGEPERVFDTLENLDVQAGWMAAAG